jgi:hypothetical protein
MAAEVGAFISARNLELHAVSQVVAFKGGIMGFPRKSCRPAANYNKSLRLVNAGAIVMCAGTARIDILTG